MNRSMELIKGNNATDHHTMPMGHNMTDLHMGHNMTDHMNMDHNMTDHMNMDHNMTDHVHMDHDMIDHMDMARNLTAQISHADHSVTGSPHLTDHGHPMNGGHPHDPNSPTNGHNTDHGPHNQLHGYGHDMKMYFHTGINEYVLFEDAYIRSNGAFIGACLAVFVAALLYEGLKLLREVCLQRALKRAKSNVYCLKELEGESTNCANIRKHLTSKDHFLQVFLHVIQMVLSYSLMLVFMTFNVWLCLALVLGAGYGHYLFGWQRASIADSNEHCH